MPASIDRRGSRAQARCANSMNGVSSMRTPDEASRSSISLESNSSLVSRSCVSLSWPPLSRASAAKVERPLFTLSTLCWMWLVDWAMPSVWRSTRATMSATSRTVSLIRAKRALRDPALLDAGLDLGGHRLGLAGQRGDGAGDLAGRGAGVVGELLHLGGDDRERAARLAGARRLDRGVEREHVGLAGDRLDARGDVLDPGHRLGEAGHAVAQLDDEIGEAGEDRGSCPRSRRGPGRACRAPARRARAPRRWNRRPGPGRPAAGWSPPRASRAS